MDSYSDYNDQMLSDQELDDQKKRLAQVLSQSFSQAPASGSQESTPSTQSYSSNLDDIAKIRDRFSPKPVSVDDPDLVSGLNKISDIVKPDEAPQAKPSMLANALLAAIPGVFGSIAGGKAGGGIGFTEGSKQLADVAKEQEAQRKEAAKLDLEIKKIKSGFVKDYILLPKKAQLAIDQALALDAAKGDQAAKLAILNLSGKAASESQAQDFKAGESEQDRALRLKQIDETSRHNKAMEDAAAKKAAAGPKGGEKLLPEVQAAVSDIAKKTANKSMISNQIDAVVSTFDDKNISEDQKVAAGLQLIKTLNSTEGQDAVGAEESKRLASFLDYKLFNMTRPGSFIGRDTDEFRKQAVITSSNVKKAAKENNSLADRMRKTNSLVTPNQAVIASPITDDMVAKYSAQTKKPMDKARKELEEAMAKRAMR